MERVRRRKKEQEEVKSINRINQLGFGWNTFFTIVLVLAAATVIIPVLLIIIISFSSEESLGTIGYSFFPLEWSLEGYKYLFKMGDQLFDSYVITIFYTVVGTAMSLVVETMYAYVISQKSFWLNRALTWFMFFTMLFSGGLVPSYILNVRYLHLNDTIWIFLLPSLISAGHVIILRTFIRTNIPEGLMDAARIDGAGHFRVFTQIVIPLSKAGTATIALFQAVSRWNNWFTGLLYVENSKLVPLQTLLQKMQNNIDYLKQNTRAADTPDGIEMLKNLPSASLRLACTVIAIVPIMFAYPFFQRYFVSGLTVGSIKE